MTCPTLEELLAALAAETPSPAAARVLHHAAECPTCAAARRWIERVRETAAGGPLPDVPPEPLAAAAAIPARERAARPVTEFTPLQRVGAALSGSLTAGVRGPEASGSRTLYGGGDAELDVEVVAGRAGEGVRVTGQLLLRALPPPPHVLAALWAGSRRVAAAEGDAAGIFVLPGVPPAVYRLSVWAPAEGRGVEIDPLDLGKEPT